MRKNRIRDIAKVFDLKLYESFYLKLYNRPVIGPGIFQFQEHGLYRKEDNDSSWQNVDYVLTDMINGNFEVVKINQSVKPTDAQLNYIKDIEEYLEVEFEGETKQDATKFLNKYVPIYKHRLEVDMAEQEAMIETANIERSQVFKFY